MYDTTIQGFKMVKFSVYKTILFIGKKIKAKELPLAFFYPNLIFNALSGAP